MARYFDEKKWSNDLLHEKWYTSLFSEYRSLMDTAAKSSAVTSISIHEDIYSFIEEKLTQGKIALGKEGPNWDAERKPIDTVVLHHTNHPPGITLERLNAIQLIRIYAYYYSVLADKKNLPKEGKAIFSGHFRDSAQVFYSYHWLVREDGTAERLLGDNETGWQAGNWDVNCRSVGICFDSDLENASPTKKAISGARELIKKQYSWVNPKNIIGHLEINSKTLCPGGEFTKKWKREILSGLV